jgi:hypothetical protein
MTLVAHPDVVSALPAMRAFSRAASGKFGSQKRKRVLGPNFKALADAAVDASQGTALSPASELSGEHGNEKKRKIEQEKIGGKAPGCKGKLGRIKQKCRDNAADELIFTVRNVPKKSSGPPSGCPVIYPGAVNKGKVQRNHCQRKSKGRGTRNGKGKGTGKGQGKVKDKANIN